MTFLFYEMHFCNYTFTPLPVFIVLKIVIAMENKTEGATGLADSGNYLQVFFYRAPKKNHDSIAKNLAQFVPWFKKNGVRIEYYQFGDSETQSAINSAKQSGMDSLDSIANSLSLVGDEEVWMELIFYRDRKHRNEAEAEMNKDESMGPLFQQSTDLVATGTGFIMGEFSRLEV